MAGGIDPIVDLNPVLLKPETDVGAQVVHGKRAGHAKAREYQTLKPKLLSAVLERERPSAGSDLVLIEGAGSPAEINLRAGDISNMGFAGATRCPVCWLPTSIAAVSSPRSSELILCWPMPIAPMWSAT